LACSFFLHTIACFSFFLLLLRDHRHGSHSVPFLCLLLWPRSYWVPPCFLSSISTKQRILCNSLCLILLKNLCQEEFSTCEKDCNPSTNSVHLSNLKLTILVLCFVQTDNSSSRKEKICSKKQKIKQNCWLSLWHTRGSLRCSIFAAPNSSCCLKYYRIGFSHNSFELGWEMSSDDNKNLLEICS
jgi:hypothetical protein